LKEVVEVAAHLAGGLIVGRHVVAWKPGQRLGQEGLLDQASNPQLLFDALPFLSLLLLFGHSVLQLPAVRIGERSIRVNRAELEQFLLDSRRVVGTK
jgi:hypothetical protein